MTNEKQPTPELQMRENELALLAYFADVGIKVVRAQLVGGQIPENKVQMVKAMLSDCEHVLDNLRAFAAEKQKAAGQQGPGKDTAEMGQPGVKQGPAPDDSEVH